MSLKPAAIHWPAPGQAITHFFAGLQNCFLDFPGSDFHEFSLITHVMGRPLTEEPTVEEFCKLMNSILIWPRRMAE